jgi:hypothetical protein
MIVGPPAQRPQALAIFVAIGRSLIEAWRTAIRDRAH